MSCCFDLDAPLRERDRGGTSIWGGARNAHARRCELRVLRSSVHELTPSNDALSSSS